MVSIVALAVTLVLFFNTPHGIYMAADSRYSNTPPPERDKAQKILQCGKWGVCALSGNLVFDANARDLAGKTVAHHLDLTKVLAATAAGLEESTAVEQTRFLASRVNAEIRAFWDPAIVNKRLESPLDPKGDPDQNSVCTMLFAKRRGGDVALYQLRFPFHELPRTAGGWANYLDAPEIVPLRPNLGDRTVAQGLVNCTPVVNRGFPVQSRTTLLRAINQTYSGATSAGGECSAWIGGPVDIAMVDDDGFRWLQKKR